MRLPWLDYEVAAIVSRLLDESRILTSRSEPLGAGRRFPKRASGFALFRTVLSNAGWRGFRIP